MAAGKIFPITLLLALLSASSEANPLNRPRLSQPAHTVEAWDFIEITLKIDSARAQNPFIDASLEGEFGKSDDNHRLKVLGFCDASDGSLFRIRFMPQSPGDYTYSLTYRQGSIEFPYTGRFRVVAGRRLSAGGVGRRGILRADPAYPFHFLWQGTGDHYFLNGTTAFMLMGWADEKVVTACLDRFQRFKINRVRVLLTGRWDIFATEPIKNRNGFNAILNPWLAERPDSIQNPGFDYARFNVAHWQKFERLLRAARERNIIISVILDWNDTKAHTAAGSEDERRYFRYAAARLGGYSNLTWDLGDDLDSFRDEAWTHAAGTYLMSVDPYRHLATSHPVHNEHQDRTADWFGMTSFQQWPRPLHQWMLDQRKQQAQTGRLIPQVNEEYGYEDHYPEWNPVAAPGCSADADRRAAWEIAMAGTYQTTGETAKRGTGVPPDTGGGWVNGRADASMLLLELQSHMVDFFTSFDWWKAEPHDELVNQGAFCLAQPGEVYAVYLPHGGQVTVKLEPGPYHAHWVQPRTGQTAVIGEITGPDWTSPKSRDIDDWALLVRRAKRQP